MTTINLVVNAPPEVRAYIRAGYDRASVPDSEGMSFLSPYVYLAGVNSEDWPRAAVRYWVLDSGAFSAYTRGIKIDIDEYIRWYQERKQGDPRLREVFALDVIGDWRQGVRNTEYMWKRGVPAIPCYHYGEPADVLVGLARDYPKIALGGSARMTPAKKIAFFAACFDKVWPKPMHCFGCASDTVLTAFPFHSADASSWIFRSRKYGHAYGFKQAKNPAERKTRTNDFDSSLALALRYFSAQERWLQGRWRKEMAMLNKQLGGDYEQG